VGNYTVSLTATNSAGSNTAVVTNDITVTTGTVGVPVASFTESSTSGILPLIVQFTDTTANTPTTWRWDFGDGATSTEENPAHSYATAGTYTVLLTATNTAGSNSATQLITINAVAEPAAVQVPTTIPTTAPLPAVSFTGTPITGTAPLTVIFNANTPGSPESVSWDFGDGGTSTDNSPSYTYVIPGTYTVIMTATYSGGKKTSMKTGYITVGGESATESPLPPVTTLAGLMAGAGIFLGLARRKQR